jgi:hypothetical protein
MQIGSYYNRNGPRRFDAARHLLAFAMISEPSLSSLAADCLLREFPAIHRIDMPAFRQAGPKTKPNQFDQRMLSLRQLIPRLPRYEAMSPFAGSATVRLC